MSAQQPMTPMGGQPSPQPTPMAPQPPAPGAKGGAPMGGQPTPQPAPMGGQPTPQPAPMGGQPTPQPAPMASQPPAPGAKGGAPSSPGALPMQGGAPNPVNPNLTLDSSRPEQRRSGGREDMPQQRSFGNREELLRNMQGLSTMQGGAPNPVNPNVTLDSSMPQQRRMSREDMPQQRSFGNREELLRNMQGLSTMQAPQPMRRGGPVHSGLGAIVPRRR